MLAIGSVSGIHLLTVLIAAPLVVLSRYYINLETPGQFFLLV